MKQEAKPPLGGGNSSVGVPEEGLEPSNPYECRILSPVRMPIPRSFINMQESYMKCDF